MRPEQSTLQDILMAIQLIQDFLGESTYEEFVSDSKTQSAVLHQLLVIGEAVARLPEAMLKGHPSIPWVQIKGMRNRLIHAYHDVDLEQVWETAQKDLAPLEVKVEEVLESLERSQARS